MMVKLRNGTTGGSSFLRAAPSPLHVFSNLFDKWSGNHREERMLIGRVCTFVPCSVGLEECRNARVSKQSFLAGRDPCSPPILGTWNRRFRLGSLGNSKSIRVAKILQKKHMLGAGDLFEREIRRDPLLLLRSL